MLHELGKEVNILERDSLVQKLWALLNSQSKEVDFQSGGLRNKSKTWQQLRNLSRNCMLQIEYKVGIPQEVEVDSASLRCTWYNRKGVSLKQGTKCKVKK